MPSPTRPLRRSILPALLLALAGCVSIPGDGWPVTPQRPRISRTTSTTAAGSFELEAGLALDPGDSLALVTEFKHGLHEDTELFLGWAPYQSIELPGEDADGAGDLTLGMRHRFWEDGRGNSVAFQTATKLPVGDEDEGLSSGEVDFFAAGMLTHVPDELTTVTGYYELGVIGEPSRADTDLSHRLALAGTYRFEPETLAFGEISRLHAAFGPDPMIALGGVARTVSESLVIDVALALGVNDDAPDAMLLVGLTTNLGRLRRDLFQEP